MLRSAIVGSACALGVAGSACGAHCNAIVECQPPLVVDARVSLAVAATNGLSLAFCRNQACANGTLFDGAATLSGAFTVHVTATGSATASTDVVFTPAFQGYVGGSGDVSDGDAYEVKIADGANVILDDTRTIQFAHTSPGCRSGACYAASYTIAP